MAFETLGWEVTQISPEKRRRALKEGDTFEIIENLDGEKIYIAKELPAFSSQESSLVLSVLEEFVKSRKTKKQATISETLFLHCEKNSLELEDTQKEYILAILNSMAFGFGPLDQLLSNKDLEEIAVIGTQSQKPVFVYEKNWGWLKTNFFFTDKNTVINLANKMGAKIGRHLSHQNPCLNAFLPDGSRLNAAIPPMTDEPAITIRKFREEPFTPAQLVSNKTFSAKAMAFLWLCMQADCSTLVCGNTGSGKTSTVNALFSFAPKNERIVVAEETPEIVLLHSHVARLKTDESIGVSMDDLITNTLRMRPDRLIVGEVRNAKEAGAFANAVLSGQAKSSFATFHAKSTQEAIFRLQKLGVAQADIGFIDLVVVQKRWDRIDTAKKTRRELRRATEISEVIFKDESCLVNTLFEFNYKKMRLEEKNESLKMLEKICNTFGFAKANAKKELKNREKFLMDALVQQMNSKKFFSEANNAFA